ncbi:MAG: hypothetical protein Q9172_007519, partial [Xanthocarpia lactea]
MDPAPPTENGKTHQTNEPAPTTASTDTEQHRRTRYDNQTKSEDMRKAPTHEAAVEAVAGKATTNGAAESTPLTTESKNASTATATIVAPTQGSILNGIKTSSDVVTTPTPSMLTSIQNCTLLDDVFAEDPTTTALESHISALTGLPAALLVTSGTMGNQLSIRTHMTQPPHSLLADHRSHIFQWEAGGLSSLSGAFPIQVVPQNQHHLTLDDIKKHTILDDDVHHAPTTLISLENTLNGSILPLSACRAISHFAHQHNIKLHLDGARLWEAVSAKDAGSLKEYCQCFDSVSLCFSKGLGAPIGSIIVGSEKFVKRARH